MKTLARPSRHVKPPPDSPLTHKEAFKCAFSGLCAGARFYSKGPDGLSFHLDAKDELKLLKHLAYLSYNAASFACAIYNDQEVKAFSEI
jgi:hypothetical protein